jgi:hypothetical protein
MVSIWVDFGSIDSAYNVPRLILRGKSVAQVAAGRYHSLALTCESILSNHPHWLASVPALWSSFASLRCLTRTF